MPWSMRSVPNGLDRRLLQPDLLPLLTLLYLGASSDGGAQDDHGVPSSQEEALQELAEVCRRNPAYRALVNEIRSETAGQAVDSAGPAASSDPPAVGGHLGTSSEDDHGVPSSQEALQELAEVCRADSDVLCLASEELDEIVALAASSVRDLSGPSGQRIQALVDKEYDQFVTSLPIPQPKASRSASEHSGASYCRGRGRRPRGARHASEATRPLSKRQQRRRLYGIIQELYRKNRTRCAKTALSGDWAKEKRTTSLEEQDSYCCLLYTSPSPRDRQKSRMPSSA